MGPKSLISIFMRHMEKIFLLFGILMQREEERCVTIRIGLQQPVQPDTEIARVANREELTAVPL